MKYSYAFALAAAQLAAAHTTFQSFVIDGKDQGQHFAVRTPSNGNNPIKDVTSTLMTCNGGAATADTVEVAAGSDITFQWHHNDPATTSGDADEPIAASHKGPVLVYVAPAESNGEGAVWTKVFEEGLVDGKWAVEKFITNKGQITITLPDLAAGDYLIRPEIIALHEGNREGGAQLYNGCGQIKVTGGSASLPATGVDLTKAYSATDPGILFDIYSGATTYEIPGPAVWDGASGGSSPAPTKTAAASSAAATSAAATSAAAPATSAAPTSAAAEATPTEAATSAPAATSAAAPAPTSGSGSGSSTLPEEFTLPEFIAWLKETTGATGASKARRHARSFFG